MTGQWGQVRHRVVIGGHVLNEKTQRPVAGAIVQLTAVPEEFKIRRDANRDAVRQSNSKRIRRLDETQTSPTGQYYFCDLPKGSYGLKATGLGRNPPVGTGKVNVIVDKNGSVMMATVDLVLREPT